MAAIAYLNNMRGEGGGERGQGPGGGSVFVKCNILSKKILRKLCNENGCWISAEHFQVLITL